MALPEVDADLFGDDALARSPASMPATWFRRCRHRCALCTRKSGTRSHVACDDSREGNATIRVVLARATGIGLVISPPAGGRL